jgi:sugar lactone lactonase YvrE
MLAPQRTRLIAPALKVMAGIAVVCVLYLVAWPVEIDPTAWTPPRAPSPTGVFAPNDRLTHLEKVAERDIGPESVAIDARGYLYTGLLDGRIVRIESDAATVGPYAQAREPLGMEFDVDGNLIVADASLGLISVDPGGNIATLTREVDGTPINFADDLAIASDGTIYFTDASTKFTNRESVSDIFEHRPNGRLLAYTPSTGLTRVVLDGLYFPNGAAIGPNEAYLLFNETSMYRVRRYWLTGERAGQTDTFIDNLPGFPDNISFNSHDTFWVALAGGPRLRAALDPLLPHPFLRKIVWRIPGFLSGTSTGEGYVVGLDLHGNVVHTLQDPSGETYPDTTSVIEHMGWLYIGSFSAHGVGRVRVPESRGGGTVPERGLLASSSSSTGL